LLILGIDTSKTNHINISLSENNKVIETIYKDTKKTEETINIVYELFIKNNIKPEQLKGLGVITGPGGYTGIRAGVSVAKTMSQLLNIPCVAFNKVDLYFSSFNDEFNSDQKIYPLVDIKRDEIYTFNPDSNDNDYIVLTIENFINILEKSTEKTTILANEVINKNDLFSKLLNKDISFNYNFKIDSIDICNQTFKAISNGYAKSYRDIIPVYSREAV